MTDSEILDALIDRLDNNIDAKTYELTTDMYNTKMKAFMQIEAILKYERELLLWLRFRRNETVILSKTNLPDIEAKRL